MFDAAVSVSPVRLICLFARKQRRANFSALTCLNTRRRRRSKFNGDSQLAVLSITLLVMAPMVWWFSCELQRGREARCLTSSAHIAQSANTAESAYIGQPVVPAVVHAEALGASLRLAIGKKYRQGRQSASSNYLPSLVMEQANFESSGVAQEICSGLLFEIGDLEDSRRSDLYVRWECDDCRNGRLKLASKIADCFKCGALLLAGLAFCYYRVSLQSIAVANRLKLYSQLRGQRHSSKQKVFKTLSRASNRMRWREWSIQSRWLS